GHCAERQCHLRFVRESRVAAGEDQAESLVGHGFLVVHGWELGEPLEQLGLAGERALTADPVDRAVPGGGAQPPGWVVWHAVSGPALDGCCKRVLEGVLGELEVAEDADQGREDAAPLLADDLLEARRAQCSITGLISIAPPVRAAGIFAAPAVAPPRVSGSIPEH